jgi:hypothetical protein
LDKPLVRNAKFIGDQQVKFKESMNFKDGDKGYAMRPEFEGKSTMDLILSGDRTATTRKTTKLKKGDIVQFTESKGEKRTVIVRVTADPKAISKITPSEWSEKEGWAESVYEVLGKREIQIEFEVLDKDNIVPLEVKPGTKETGGLPAFAFQSADGETKSLITNDINSDLDKSDVVVSTIETSDAIFKKAYASGATIIASELSPAALKVSKYKKGVSKVINIQE